MLKSPVSVKKRALSLVLICAAVLLAVIGLRYAAERRQFSIKTTEGRKMFLAELGWEIDTDTEEHRTVAVPPELEGVMEEYNRLQRAQGYDLCPYCGKNCEQYTYTVTNYPDYEGQVLVTIYVKGGSVIAGDIHTSAMDGFMHSIKRSGE